MDAEKPTKLFHMFFEFIAASLISILGTTVLLVDLLYGADTRISLVTCFLLFCEK